jgi:hypothetical protein
MRQIFLIVALVLLVGVPGAFADEGKQGKKNKDLKGKPKVTVGANLHSLWSYTDANGPNNQFSVEMARLYVKFKQGKTIDAKLQGDFDALFGDGEKKAMLRDAWVRFRPIPWFGIKAGQQKRPFSRIQLRPKGTFETVWRGPADAWLAKELQYGDRDIGVTLAFDFDWKRGRELLVTLGVFNGTGKNADETDLDGAKDFVGRIEGSPVKWLALGASGSLKMFDRVGNDFRPEQSWAAGADLQVDWKGLLVVAEGLFGENWDPCLFSSSPESCTNRDLIGDVSEPFWPTSATAPQTWSAVLMLAYKIPVYKAWKLSLQPVLKGEYMVPDVDANNSAVMTGTVGVNLWVGKHFRFMVQGESVLPGDGAPPLWQEENRIMTQVAFDL